MNRAAVAAVATTAVVVAVVGFLAFGRAERPAVVHQEERSIPPPQPAVYTRLKDVKPRYDPAINRKKIGRCYDKALGTASVPSYDRVPLLQRWFSATVRPQETAAIAAAVEHLRGHKFRTSPDVLFLSPKDLSRRIVERVHQRYSEAGFRVREDILSTLRALRPRENLRAAGAEYKGSHTLGFYVEKQRRVYAPHSGEGISLEDEDRHVLAHELLHALNDQVLPDPLIGYRKQSEADAWLAIAAVVEGDGNLTEQLFKATVLNQFPQIVLRPARKQNSYRYLRHEAAFRYADGTDFVCAVFLRGGWKAVDGLYREPPISTAEILWPHRYFTKKRPVDPRNISAPGGEWERVSHQTIGALQLFLLFEAPGGYPKNAIASARKIGSVLSDWNGSELDLYRNDFEENALGIAMETSPGDSALCQAMGRWFKRSYPVSKIRRQGYEMFAYQSFNYHAVVWCKDREIRVGIAPDLETARKLIQ